jgi:hypothetical protein
VTRLKFLVAGASAFLVVGAISGCTAATAVATCSSHAVRALSPSITSATTTTLGKTVPSPLSYVIKGRSDINCTADAVIVHSGAGGTESEAVLIVNSPISQVRGQIDSASLSRGGNRGLDGGSQTWVWMFSPQQSLLEAVPYGSDKTLIATQTSK